MSNKRPGFSCPPLREFTPGDMATHVVVHNNVVSVSHLDNGKALPFAQGGT